MFKKVSALITIAMLACATAGCTAVSTGGNDTKSGSSEAIIIETSSSESRSETSTVVTEIDTSSSAGTSESSSSETSSSAQNTGSTETTDSSGLFTDRDLAQSADLSEAVYYTAADNTTETITAAGVYVVSGTAENYTIIVETDDEAKVQIVLDSLNVTNDDTPVIYVKNADKVFVTTAEGTSSTLSVTDTFTADGDTSTDAVIFSKDDLVLNGLGTLTIESTDNGISCKDDLKITGGTISISCPSDAIEVNDSILMYDGNITIQQAEDGLHAENDEDDTVGSIQILGGTLNISVSDDAIHAITTIQIDGGTLNLDGAEGIEATQVEINAGTINITASDDGINAGQKSDSMNISIVINGGEISIDMAQGDTDGIDSNGDLTINGGTISINAQSPFDCDGAATYNGGTIIVNGVETNQITTQMMGGGMGGGFGGRGGR